MLLIAEEVDEQRQIDRACAAQSPDLLPTPRVEVSQLEAARERIKKQKEGYNIPAAVFASKW